MIHYTYINVYIIYIYIYIYKIEFRSIRTIFQSKVKEDLKKVKSCKIMVFADKTANKYKMSKEEYAKHLNDVTKMHQKTTISTKTKVDKTKLENKIKNMLINQHILN